MYLKKVVKKLLLIKAHKTSCIVTSVSLTTVSEAVVTTSAASLTPTPNSSNTERFDHNRTTSAELEEIIIFCLFFKVF